MRFLEWWTTLSPWIRYPIAVIIIGGSLLGFATLPWGNVRAWSILCAIGVVLLIIGPTKSNKKGYHF
jgi:hypothetical protein